jgi:hypothetical protein
VFVVISAADGGGPPAGARNGRVCDDGGHAIIDGRCANYEIAAKADAEKR